MVMQPSWRVLYAHLDPADARELGDELTAAKIPFDVTPDGTTLKVPADQLDKARLETAAKGGPKSGRLGFELFDKPNWVGSEFDERVNYQRALEGELEHTIASLGSVKSAHVHLVFPHESLFTERQEEAKASVLLKLRQRDLSPQEVDAIRNLVASAVDHLSASNVTLVDADGRAQLGVRNPDAAASGEEQRLADRLVATLEPVTGEGNVRASVHLEYDTTAADETDEIYDPNGTVTLSMQRSEQQTGDRPATGGVPGTVSNAPNAQPPLLPPPRTAGAASMKEESGTYGASKKTRHIVEGAGRLKRATIAVLINDRPQATGQGAAVSQVPWTPDQLKRITELAQAAVGYDAARGDVISVENLAFRQCSRDARIDGESCAQYGAESGPAAVWRGADRTTCPDPPGDPPGDAQPEIGSIAGSGRPDFGQRCASGGDRSGFALPGAARPRHCLPEGLREHCSGQSAICTAVAHVA